MIQVAGVDGCKAGWVAALVTTTIDDTHAPSPLTIEALQVSPHFADVLGDTQGYKLICVDIPIGLPDSPTPRPCDREARKLLGPRASSVFSPPARACLSASDYEAASRINLEVTGKKLSKQSFFIMDKIKQVDDLLTPAMQERVHEIHPEVGFYILNGHQPTRYNKKRLSGRQERMRLLAPFFPDAEHVVATHRRTGAVEPDDILDALVAAWTAATVAQGHAVTLPQHPDRDSKNFRMEILCPSLTT